MNREFEDIYKAMEQLEEAMDISANKDMDIDTYRLRLREETRPVVVEEMKAELEDLIARKNEFNDITVNVLIRLQKQINELRQKTQKEFEKYLKDYYATKELISANMPEEALRAHEQAEKIANDVYIEKIKQLDDWEKQISEYAVSLDAFDILNEALKEKKDEEIVPENIIKEGEIEIEDDNQPEEVIEVDGEEIVEDGKGTETDDDNKPNEEDTEKGEEEPEEVIEVDGEEIVGGGKGTETDGENKPEEEKGGEMVVVPPAPIVKPNENRKKVKFTKKAKDFYKKHKKAILIVGGLILLGVAVPAILPSIMQFNSVLWAKAVGAGVAKTSALPVALHDLNIVMGSKIGATYAAQTGIWTLANGTVLNAGAASAGLLGAIGKVALTTGAVGLGATVAIKNALSLASERIKNRGKNPKRINPIKGQKINDIKEEMKKGFEKGKEKFREKWDKFSNRKQEEPEAVPEIEPDEDIKIYTRERKSDIIDDPIVSFTRDDVTPEVRAMVNDYFRKGVIKEDQIRELNRMSRDECLVTIRNIIAASKEKVTLAKFNREGLSEEALKFFNDEIAKNEDAREVFEGMNNDQLEYFFELYSKMPAYDPKERDQMSSSGTFKEEKGRSK